MSNKDAAVFPRRSLYIAGTTIRGNIGGYIQVERKTKRSEVYYADLDYFIGNEQCRGGLMLKTGPTQQSKTGMQ